MPISNGDEPYLILFAFKAEIGRPGSALIVTNEYQDDEWAENTRAGQVRPIPPGMGVFEFTGVTRQSVIGIVAVAMESDRTPWAVIDNRVQQVVDELQLVVATQIEERSNISLDDTAFIDNLHQAMVETIAPLSTSPTAGQAIENIIFSGIDTDEFIAVNSLVLMTVPPTRARSLPHYSPPYFTDVLGNKDFNLEGPALRFESRRLLASYSVELKFRRL